MRFFLQSICCTGLALACGGALAHDALALRELPLPQAPAAAVPAALAALPPLATALAQAGDLGPGAGIGEQALEQARGGTDTVSSEARLNGYVAGNSATHVNTGANIIDGGAFANASGIPIVIQNSGANVLIQNATIINLQMR